MAILASELKKFGSANHPEGDATTSGGAIDLLTTLKVMTQASSTAPKAKSSNAADTMNLTLTGYNTAGELVSEMLALNGTTLITFTTSFQANGLNKVVLASAAAGTVTIYMNDGTTVIVAVDPGVTKNARLFQNAASAATQKIRYEKEYWKNTNGTLTLNSALVQLTDDPQARLRIGVENSANQSSTNRLTAPASVTFVGDDTDIDITSLAAGASKGFWIEQDLPADDPAFNSTYTTRLAGTTTA